MARRLRFLPIPGGLVEVTTRTLQGRLLMTPSSQVNAVIKGCVARAQGLSGMAVCAIIFAANHYHVLLIPESSRQLSRFMNHLNSNLARKIGGLRGWLQKFWGRRYAAIPVSDEPAAQLERLRYLLSQGVKENLVGKPADWPGVHCVDELSRGQLEVYGGEWHDQTAEYLARQRGERVNRRDFISKEVIVLSLLPCLEGETRERVAEIVRGLVAEIEQEARERHEAEGTRPLGVKKILRQDPHGKPHTSKSSPAPRVHAATRAVRRQMIAAYWAFEDAFREAAKLLQAGILDAEFPPGSFPPPRPFIPHVEPRAG